MFTESKIYFITICIAVVHSMREIAQRTLVVEKYLLSIARPANIIPSDWYSPWADAHNMATGSGVWVFYFLQGENGESEDTPNTFKVSTRLTP